MKAARWTPEQLTAYQRRQHSPHTPTEKPRKYRNRPTWVPGPDGEPIKFPSEREAERYRQLRMLEMAGRVRKLRLQVKYHFDVNDIHICDYVADFKYEEFAHGNWREIVEDAKGYRTKEYQIKRKLMRACHGVELRET